MRRLLELCLHKFHFRRPDEKKPKRRNRNYKIVMHRYQSLKFDTIPMQ